MSVYVCVCVCVCVGGGGGGGSNHTEIIQPLTTHLLIPEEDLSKLDGTFPAGMQLGENDSTRRE